VTVCSISLFLNYSQNLGMFFVFVSSPLFSPLGKLADRAIFTFRNYRPRSRGDIHVTRLVASVRLSVGALLFEPFDL